MLALRTKICKQIFDFVVLIFYGIIQTSFGAEILEKPKYFPLLKKSKLKVKNQLKYKFFAFAAIAALLGGVFIVPEKTEASGNVYEFSKVVLTEQVQTGPTENGPWTDSNFIRVGKDKGFYVKVTIKVTSLTNKDNQTVTTFDTKNDAILTPKFWNTNLAISGVSPSFVAKVTEAQARAIGEKIKAGADPKTLPGVPCITSSITTGSMAVIKAAVIVGAATAVALTGGSAALAAGAAVNTGALAVGAGAAGAAASNAALAVAIGAGTTAGTAVGAGAGAAAGATFLSVGAQDYIQCLGPVMPAPQSKGQVEAGGIVYEQVVPVPFTAYSGLGMGNDKSQIADPTKDASTQPVNEFFVVPNVNFSAWFGLRNNFMSALGAGKSIYVQLYDKQSDADAHAKDSVPSAVPNNGQNTGSGKDMTGESNAFIAFFAMVIGTIVAFFQYLVYFVFSWLVLPLMEAILKIHPYTDNFVAIIYPGWLVVRNVCNIFFIIALIIIAMATLLRLESYQYRHLLVQLILAALLINFSLVIGQAVLGVADTVQGQFLPTNSTVARDLGKALMVEQRQWFFSGGTSFADSGYFSNLIVPLFYLAMALGSFMVFLVLTGFLVIRIIALWILLLISPVAYAAGALPTTSHYRSEWWQTFLKYAFFTPIMAFFLNLTALLSQAQQNNPILKQVTSGDAFGNDSVGQFVVKVGSNVILLIFLLAAIKVAEKFGVFGADIMAKAVKGGVFAPFAAAGWLSKAGGLKVKKEYDKATSEWANAGGWKQQAFKLAHPVAFVKGVREESKKERELYAERVKAGATEVARKQYGWRRHTESPMFLFDEHKGKELYEEEEGEWSDNEQQVLGVINRLATDAKKGDLRASIKLKHSLTEAFRHKNLNEVMTGDNGLAAKFLGGKLNKYNSDNIRYFFQRMVEEGFLDENFTKDFEKKLSKDGYEIGDFNGVELVASDPKTGHPHLIKMQKKLKDDGSWTGDAVPVGWEDTKDASGAVIKEGYVTRREALIKQADEEGKAEAKRKGETDEDKIGVIIANRLAVLEDTVAKADHDYANSMHAERGRRYMKINMSKKTGTAQLGMFHDSAINVGSIDGDVDISDAGTEIIGHMDAGKMYAMARDNMPAKTKDKFMLYIKGVVKNVDKGLAKIHKDAERIVKARYRENGVVLSDEQRKKEVDDITNYWLGSGYEIISSTPGATVNQKFFEKHTADATKRELIEAIVNYKKDGASAPVAEESEENDQ